MRFAVLLAFATTAHAADEPTFKSTVQKKGDAVGAATKDGTTTFSVTSPGGIGSATVARTAAAWPEKVVLRLNLRGLEGFDAVAGKVKMRAFVNVGGMKSVAATKDGKAVEGYDAKHPLWTEVGIFDAAGKPTDTPPLKEGGYFEIAMPKAMFEGNPETLTLNWVDFYRR